MNYLLDITQPCTIYLLYKEHTNIFLNKIQKIVLIRASATPIAKKAAYTAATYRAGYPTNIALSPCPTSNTLLQLRFTIHLIMEFNLLLPGTRHSADAFEARRTETREARPLTAKRLFDIVFALLVVVLLLSWLIPLVALIIKMESKGPALFKQLRTGKDNQPFFCFKFRSMQVNDEAHHKQACKGDARITRVGAFIRKTNIDELPQFFNVLRGEMSIVGPRPHMLKHTEQYSQVVSGFMQRHTVTPGITGLAQVRGFRGETKETIAMAKRVKFDIWYIKNRSFWLDVKIVVMTMVQAVKGHDNAF